MYRRLKEAQLFTSGNAAASEVKVPFANTAILCSRYVHTLSAPPDSFCNSPSVEAVVMSGRPPSSKRLTIKLPTRQNASLPEGMSLSTTFNPFGAPTASAIPIKPALSAAKELALRRPLSEPDMSNPSLDVKRQPIQRDQEMKPSNNFNAENAITLFVGLEQQKLTVHASYITRTSTFFAAALKNEWAEGQTRIIELQEETPEMMAHYLDWIYTSALPTKDCGLFHPESAKIAAHDLLAELYVLASADSTPTSATPSPPSSSASD
jgi:hypothetical protein